MNERHRIKDIAKFAICNKLISRGATGSSSALYVLEGIGNITIDKVNCGEYTTDDIVGISSNGNRRGRLTADFDEIDKAIDARAEFITDGILDARRTYNVGEREVRRHLLSKGYINVFDVTIYCRWVAEDNSFEERTLPNLKGVRT